MNFRINWQGELLIARANAATPAAINQTLDEMVPDVKANTPVDTGAARDSVHKHPAQGGITAKGQLCIGEGLRYPFWLEVGSQGRPGHHMMRNGFDKHAGDLRGNLKDKLGAIR